MTEIVPPLPPKQRPKMSLNVKQDFVPTTGQTVLVTSPLKNNVNSISTSEIQGQDNIGRNVVKIKINPTNQIEKNSSVSSQSAINKSVISGPIKINIVPNENEVMIHTNQTENFKTQDRNPNPYFFYSSFPPNEMVMSSGQCSPSDTLDSGTCSDLDTTPPPLPKKKSVSVTVIHAQHKRTNSIGESEKNLSDSDIESNISCDSLNSSELNDDSRKASKTNSPCITPLPVLMEKPALSIQFQKFALGENYFEENYQCFETGVISLNISKEIQEQVVSRKISSEYPSIKDQSESKNSANGYQVVSTDISNKNLPSKSLENGNIQFRNTETTQISKELDSWKNSDTKNANGNGIQIVSNDVSIKNFTCKVSENGNFLGKAFGNGEITQILEETISWKNSDLKNSNGNGFQVVSNGCSNENFSCKGLENGKFMGKTTPESGFGEEEVEMGSNESSHEVLLNQGGFPKDFNGLGEKISTDLMGLDEKMNVLDLEEPSVNEPPVAVSNGFSDQVTVENLVRSSNVFIDQSTYEDRYISKQTTLSTSSFYEDDKFYKFHINENFSTEEGKNINNSEIPKCDIEHFAGYKDILSEQGTTIKSAKGTIRGVKNRVRNGIATFLQINTTAKNYKEKDAGKVVVYTTTMGIVRRTYQQCVAVKQILRTHLVKFEERDVFMSCEYQQEIRDRMTCDQILVPQVFVDGQHIGDAETIERLNESGELRRILKPYKSADACTTCQVCGGYRLLPCPVCNGSKKSVHRNHFTTEFVALKCMNCDEVGLVKCSSC